MKYGKLTLGQIEAIINKLGGEEKAEAFLRGELIVSPAEASNLLRQIATVSVSGFREFVAKDHLRSANIGLIIESNFKYFFLEKIEKNVGPINLAVYRLEKSSLDTSILAKLGDCAEISLAYFFELLKRQAYRQKGQLLTNGFANIAYVRGSDGDLLAVSAQWRGSNHDWYVDVASINRPSRRLKGRYVVSRNL